jgi:hypothetical protein
MNTETATESAASATTCANALTVAEPVDLTGEWPEGLARRLAAGYTSLCGSAESYWSLTRTAVDKSEGYGDFDVLLTLTGWGGCGRGTVVQASWWDHVTGSFLLGEVQRDHEVPASIIATVGRWEVRAAGGPITVGTIARADEWARSTALAMFGTRGILDAAAGEVIGDRVDHGVGRYGELTSLVERPRDPAFVGNVESRASAAYGQINHLARRGVSDPYLVRWTDTSEVTLVSEMTEALTRAGDTVTVLVPEHGHLRFLVRHGGYGGLDGGGGQVAIVVVRYDFGDDYENDQDYGDSHGFVSVERFSDDDFDWLQTVIVTVEVPEEGEEWMW